MKSKGLDSVHSWFIAIAVAILQLLAFIPLRMKGLFFVACLERYNTDRKLASLPFTLVYIMRCAVGPVVSLLEECFGLRKVTIFGTCSLVLGIFFCFFAEEITTVIISYGVLYGFGYTLASALLPKLIKQHFEKFFSVAIGITFAIPCFGIMCFLPLAEFLIEKYGISGTFLIISGVVCNAVPISITLRQPRYRSSPPEVLGNIAESCKTAENIGEENLTSISQTKTETIFNSADLNLPNRQIKNRSTVSLSCAFDQGESFFLKKNVPTNKSLPDIRILNEDRNMSNGKFTFKSYNKNCTIYLAQDVPVTDKNAADKEIILLANEKLSADRNKPFYKQNGKECLTVASVSKSSVIYKIIGAFQTMRVFGNKYFLLITLAQSLFIFSTHIFLTVIIDASTDKGVPKVESVYLVMLIPIAELSGFFALAWIVDKGCSTKEQMAASCFVIIGLTCEIFVWTDNFYSLMFGVLLFGFFESGFLVIIPGLTFDYIEVSLQSMALSSGMIFFLPLGFSVPSVIGYFRGTMGTYDNVYHFLTAVNLVGCGLIMLLPVTRKRINHE